MYGLHWDPNDWARFWLNVAQLEDAMRSEQERMKRVADLIEYYECRPDEIIERRLYERFTKAETLKLSKAWRPVIKTVINRTSLVFQRPPEITFKNDGLQSIWNEVWDETNLPSQFLTIDRYRRLCGSLLVRIDEDAMEPGGVGVTLITPNVLSVTPDPRRVTRALEYRVHRYEDTRGDTSFAGSTGGFDSRIDVFDLSDPKRPTWAVTDALGTEVRAAEQLAWNPFVAFHAQQPVSSWFAPEPNDLLVGQNRITDHVIELGHQLFLNSFSIPIIDASIQWPLGRVVLDPTMPLQWASSREKNDRPPLSYASPENDFTLAQVREAIKAEADALYEAYGLVADQSAATSGFQLAVLNLPLTRQLEIDRMLVVPSLRRFVPLVMRARGREVKPGDFTVRLEEPMLPEDATSIEAGLRVTEGEIRLNLTSIVRELKRRHPDLDDAAAERLAEEIADENRAAGGGDALDRFAAEQRRLRPGVAADEEA